MLDYSSASTLGRPVQRSAPRLVVGRDVPARFADELEIFIAAEGGEVDWKAAQSIADINRGTSIQEQADNTRWAVQGGRADCAAHLPALRIHACPFGDKITDKFLYK